MSRRAALYLSHVVSEAAARSFLFCLLRSFRPVPPSPTHCVCLRVTVHQGCGSHSISGGGGQCTRYLCAGAAEAPPTRRQQRPRECTSRLVLQSLQLGSRVLYYRYCTTSNTWYQIATHHTHLPSDTKKPTRNDDGVFFQLIAHRRRALLGSHRASMAMAPRPQCTWVVAAALLLLLFAGAGQAAVHLRTGTLHEDSPGW